MTKSIRTTDTALGPIRDTGGTLRRVGPGQVQQALGAETVPAELEEALAPLTLFALREELVNRLQSSGERAVASLAAFGSVPGALRTGFLPPRTGAAEPNEARYLTWAAARRCRDQGVTTGPRRWAVPFRHKRHGVSRRYDAFVHRYVFGLTVCGGLLLLALAAWPGVFEYTIFDVLFGPGCILLPGLACWCTLVVARAAWELARRPKEQGWRWGLWSAVVVFMTAGLLWLHVPQRVGFGI